MIPLGPTPPQTSPASLKRKRSDHDDPRVNLKRDTVTHGSDCTELEQTGQVKIHIDLTCERLLYGVQDHLSHAIASLAHDGVAHSLREKVGTNRVLNLEAAASIMAQNTDGICIIYRLLDVLEGLRSEVSALTARQDEFRQLDVIGKINSSIDLAADRICKAITEFERFPGAVRDRLCNQLASALSKDQPDEADIIRPEVTVGQYAVSEMDETITRIQKDWAKEVESHQAKVWNGLIQHVEASLPAITRHGLLRKIQLAIIYADARYRQAYILTAAPFQSSSWPMMTQPRPTSPLAPPSSLKRKRSSDDPRILLKEDIALDLARDLARKIKIHVEIAGERLLRFTQDHLSHSLASLANVGVAHLLRDKIGTNRILALEAAASIMAQRPEEAASRENVMADSKRLIEVGEQARFKE